MVKYLHLYNITYFIHLLPGTFGVTTTDEHDHWAWAETNER